MNKMVRTALHLVVSLVLFSTIAVAHAGGNNADQHKTKNKEHHSRFAKLAFWHHHKDSHGNTKQTKHVQAKRTQVKAGQTKPAAAGMKDHKPAQYASGKAAGQKTSVPNKTKPQDKAQNRTTASLKQ